ncbi:hypothetical protein BSG1_13591, partial [Bacillus sp. SG-1]
FHTVYRTVPGRNGFFCYVKQAFQLPGRHRILITAAASKRNRDTKRGICLACLR